MLLCFLAALPPVSPSEPLVPRVSRQTQAVCPACSLPPGRSRHSEVCLVHPVLSGHQSWLLCVFPAICLPVPGRPCPSGLERRSRRDQRWKSRQTAAPCTSSDFLSRASLALTLMATASLASFVLSLPSARLSLPRPLWALRAVIGCSVVSGK